MMGRALRITEKGLKRGIEILKASKPGAGKRLRWSGKTLTSEMLRAEIDSTILRAGGIPTGTIVAGGDQACDPHERGFARTRERRATKTLEHGESRASTGSKKGQSRRGRDGDSQGNPGIFRQPRVPDRDSQRQTSWILSRHRAWAGAGNS